MQVRAIFEAACNVQKEGKVVKPEVMIPLTGHVNELKLIQPQLEEIAKKVMAEKIGPKLREGTAQDRIWSVIRNKSKLDGYFTVQDLITLAEVKREMARWFVKMLRRAEYIKPSKPMGPGVEWRLIRDCGPRRPYVGGMTRRRGDVETRR